MPGHDDDGDPAPAGWFVSRGSARSAEPRSSVARGRLDPLHRCPGSPGRGLACLYVPARRDGGGGPARRGADAAHPRRRAACDHARRSALADPRPPGRVPDRLRHGERGNPGAGPGHPPPHRSRHRGGACDRHRRDPAAPEHHHPGDRAFARGARRLERRHEHRRRRRAPRRARSRWRPAGRRASRGRGRGRDRHAACIDRVRPDPPGDGRPGSSTINAAADERRDGPPPAAHPSPRDGCLRGPAARARDAHGPHRRGLDPTPGAWAIPASGC